MTDSPVLVLGDPAVLGGASRIEGTVATEEAAPLVIRPAIGAGVTSWPMRLLRMTESWHGAQRRPVPVVLDVALAAFAAGQLTSSLRTAAVTGSAVLLAGFAAGLWKPRTSLETQGAAWFGRPVLVCAVAILAGLAAAGVALRPAAGAAVTAGAALIAVRAVLWPVIGSSRRRGLGLRPAVVIAGEQWGDQLRHRMAVYPEAGLDCVAVHLPPGPEDDGSVLALALRRMRPAHVVLAGTEQSVVRQVARLADGSFDCSIAVPVKGAATGARLGDVALVALRLRPGWGSLAAKRVFDVAVASVLLLCTAPLWLVTAAAIRLSDGGPVFFKQPRVGRHGRVFKCFKFRSMVVDAERVREALLDDNINVGLLFKVQDDPRVTPVGRVIRRLSIDELPQLLNVLRGDMSMVGPRPLPVDPDDFDDDARCRHAVPPGITGLWQVHGGNALSYPDMLDLDLTYVATRTLVLDASLVARTVPALIVRRSAC